MGDPDGSDPQNHSLAVNGRRGRISLRQQSHQRPKYEVVLGALACQGMWTRGASLGHKCSPQEPSFFRSLDLRLPPPSLGLASHENPVWNRMGHEGLGREVCFHRYKYTQFSNPILPAV